MEVTISHAILVLAERECRHDFLSVQAVGGCHHDFLSVQVVGGSAVKSVAKAVNVTIFLLPLSHQVETAKRA